MLTSDGGNKHHAVQHAAYQHFAWRVQNTETRQAGRQQSRPRANGVICPVQEVQVQHRQPCQGCQQAQVRDAKTLHVAGNAADNPSTQEGTQEVPGCTYAAATPLQQSDKRQDALAL